MKKSDFIEKLNKQTDLDLDKCEEVNNILESHFIAGKKGKEKVVGEFINKLDVDREEADNLYNTCITILGTELKNKLKHPFRSKD